MLSTRYHGLGMPNMAVNCLAWKMYFLLYAWWGFKRRIATWCIKPVKHFWWRLAWQGTYWPSISPNGILTTKGTSFQNLWEVAYHLNGTIDLDSKFHSMLAQVDNVPIMERFLTMSLDDKQLATLNRVRCYKKVLFLSVIIHCDGTIILPFMMNFSEGSLPLEFPLEKPTNIYIEYWHSALHALSSAGLQLQNCFGAYTNHSVSNRNWFISEDQNCVYHSILWGGL